ncbi:nucleotidyl transferase AbiEii/AbiGii toxin family protein [Paraliobacillus sp. X-1268]|uniref:nucleotidyl transferase AbiEii/AbiGii toxin family protein n=1 Tax=Paraliobacillus sp. X-1268 TaxID=2213193 RepID=UPI000E3DB8C4|nr:nucleotidyl transferase AbiEii/AbiGii toxin family protein [Paraliobacillus sp. X-1268]
MNLHENKEVFQEVVEAASDEFNLQPFQVEKDYYVSLLLKNLQEVVPNLVFKGGTSLSKCYDVIHRFSEDIDLSINFDGGKLTSGPLKKQQKSLIQSITETIDKLDFTLLNDEKEDPIRSKRHFNKYRVGYNRTYKDETDFQMLDHILIETSLGFKPFPCEIRVVSNYITRLLETENLIYLIEEYNMAPFSMNIQSIGHFWTSYLLYVTIIMTGTIRGNPDIFMTFT